MVGKFADLLLDYCLEVKKGDILLVNAPLSSLELIKELLIGSIERKSIAYLRIILDEIGEYFYRSLTKEDIQNIYKPTDIDRALAKVPTKFINVLANYNTRAFSNIEPSKSLAWMNNYSEIEEIIWKRVFKEGSARAVLTHFPTHADAQEAGMGSLDYKEFVFKALKLHKEDPIREWKELGQRLGIYKEMLDKGRYLEIESKNAELRMRLDGRVWKVDAGRENMPGGEVFTSPVEDSVEGWVRFTYPLVYQNRVVSDVFFKFKEGKVVHYDAKDGKDYIEYLLSMDEGASRVGEIAFGMNYDITRFIKNPLFDEKIGGTMHLAIGRAFEDCNGRNMSKIHVDLVFDMREGRVKLDGRTIYEDGRMLV